MHPRVPSIVTSSWKAAGVALATLFASALPAGAQDATPPAPAPAPTVAPGTPFKDAAIGFSIEGPAGWKLTPSVTAAPTWTPRASFSEPTTGAVATIDVRRPYAVTLPKLRDEVTKTYADDKTYTVSGVTDVAVSGRRPLPGVFLDATQVRPPEPPPAGSPPPTGPVLPVVWRVEEHYLLGTEWEFRVRVQVKAAISTRFQAAIDRMFDSIALKVAGSALAAKGGGTYVDEVNGFRCRYPDAYGVRIPDREHSRVEFAPATSGPVLGVFSYPKAGDLDAEAKVLVDYYTGTEVGGEASTSRIQIAGLDSVLVTGKGNVGGANQVFFVAVVQRGETTFRLRVAADATQEAAAKATFDAFAKSFVLTNG